MVLYQNQEMSDRVSSRLHTGTLLFILFMNDVVLDVQDGMRFYMYVDDSSQHCAGRSLEEVST